MTDNSYRGSPASYAKVRHKRGGGVIRTEETSKLCVTMAMNSSQYQTGRSQAASRGYFFRRTNLGPASNMLGWQAAVVQEQQWQLQQQQADATALTGSGCVRCWAWRVPNGRASPVCFGQNLRWCTHCVKSLNLTLWVNICIRRDGCYWAAGRSP